MMQYILEIRVYRSCAAKLRNLNWQRLLLNHHQPTDMVRKQMLHRFSVLYSACRQHSLDTYMQLNLHPNGMLHSTAKGHQNVSHSPA